MKPYLGHSQFSKEKARQMESKRLKSTLSQIQSEAPIIKEEVHPHLLSSTLDHFYKVHDLTPRLL
jgi:hypothetical protein